MEPQFVTYILQSLKSGRYYIGHTQNIEERLFRHNSGMVKATRSKGPWQIVYTKTFLNKMESNQYELYIKAQKSKIFIERLIENL